METLNVLIVDDEPGMRIGAERALRNFSFHVPDAGVDVDFKVDQLDSGEAALERIKSDPPDILLLDHKLPGISGMDVLDAIPDTVSDMLTVMITAYASIETALKATRQGAYDFLPKPFTPAELKSSVKKAAARVVLVRKARKLAQERKRVRFEFIRVLGHELKAPLGAVESYLELIQNKTLGDSVDVYEEALGRCTARLEQMRKLIADLLDMTKIESGQRSRELADIDIVKAAKNTMETLEVQAKERDITLDLHAPDELVMKADSSELDMIFNNLVSNAVKYNKDGGKVDITIQPFESGAKVAVSDTGIGMKPEDVAKLFGEFVRIKNAKTRNILGSGLGLSILKRLAGLYGGDVTVESEPDVGSTFTVTLPGGEGTGEAQ